MSKKIDSNEIKKDWRDAMKLFSIVSGWVIGPIVFAVFFGNWLDDKNQSHPFFSLTSVGIAFIITCVGIVREALKAIKSLK